MPTLPEKRDEREEKLIASEAKAMKVLDKRNKRFSFSWTKNSIENKELKASLKTKVATVATVATVWEEKKAAVKELATKMATVWEEKKVAVKELATKVAIIWEEMKATVKELGSN